MDIPSILFERLATANYVAVLTGAGVSAESGIKTFRDPDGLWAKFNPAELASIDGFMSNPQRVWDWYQYRIDVIKNTKPNLGHYALAEFAKHFQHFSLITQNVDRLHQAAGSTGVIELHGNIIENHCFECKSPYTGKLSESDNEVPRCPKCNGLIRPSVVWFGEMLPAEALNQASFAAESCDVFFSIGTSAEVYPAANLPILAKKQGAFVVEINPNSTALTPYIDCHLAAPSAIALPELLNEFIHYKNQKPL